MKPLKFTLDGTDYGSIRTALLEQAAAQGVSEDELDKAFDGPFTIRIPLDGGMSTIELHRRHGEPIALFIVRADEVLANVVRAREEMSS